MIPKEAVGAALPRTWRDALDVNIIEVEDFAGTSYKVSEIVRTGLLLFMLIDLKDKPKWIEAGRALNRGRE